MHLIQSEILIVYKIQVKPNQQQRAPSLKFGSRNRNGSHGDGFNQALLTKEEHFYLCEGGRSKVCTGLHTFDSFTCLGAVVGGFQSPPHLQLQALPPF
jgi:hypothetical protein